MAVAVAYARPPRMQTHVHTVRPEGDVKDVLRLGAVLTAGSGPKRPTKVRGVGKARPRESIFPAALLGLRDALPAVLWQVSVLDVALALLRLVVRRCLPTLLQRRQEHRHVVTSAGLLVADTLRCGLRELPVSSEAPRFVWQVDGHEMLVLARDFHHLPPATVVK